MLRKVWTFGLEPIVVPVSPLVRAAENREKRVRRIRSVRVGVDTYETVVRERSKRPERLTDRSVVKNGVGPQRVDRY